MMFHLRVEVHKHRENSNWKIKVSEFCAPHSHLSYFKIFSIVQVWLWKTILWLMFLSAHSFQNLSPSWALFFNLMGSLMPIFKKIHPISGFCSPSWSICCSSLCKQSEYLLQCLWFLLRFLYSCFCCGLMTSATCRSIYIL